MIVEIDPTDQLTSRRIVEIQRAAYAIEAELINFDGIPPLHESADDIQQLTTLCWRGITIEGTLQAIIAWEVGHNLVDIDRLAVDPACARRGYGRRLVRAVPTNKKTTVSTGTKNTPARQLYASEGFEPVGQTEIAPGVFTTQFERITVEVT